MYDEIKFLQYLEKEATLKQAWERFQETATPQEREFYLKSMYHVYVEGNQAAMQEYAQAA
jgi:hypothetical protein